MKWYLLLVSFFASCLVSNGELTRKQLKDLGGLVEIDGVRVETEENNKGDETEIVTVEFSSEDEGLDEIIVRIAVEVTDKAKNTYLIEQEGGYGDLSETQNYTGEGYWKLSIPYGSFKRVKITAYAVEFGVMDGETFVAFDSDYDDVKSLEELTARTTTPFPGKCKFRYNLWVDSY